MTDRPATAPDATGDARSAAAARLPERIAFLGFGLIGGSIAMALREAGSPAHLIAWTPSGAGPAEGARRGLLDTAAGTAAEVVDGAGLVILAGPPLAILGLLGSDQGLGERVSANATVTDVGSTKARIVATAAAAGLRFVGGHPMAGREVSGVGGATADLFIDRPWVVIPGRHATEEDTERVESLALATGARPIRMAADEHDAAVAAISHLPLVLSAALVESVAGPYGDGTTWPLARRLAASGWADMTRLARGDPEMGAGIVATNQEAIADRLVALRNTLQTWIDWLTFEGADAGVIRDELARARRALEEAETA
jgi:prephenate dehydrogenase